MGHIKTIIEQTEYGGTVREVKKKVVPYLVADDYQAMLSACIYAVEKALQTGKKGNFGIEFFVNTNENKVKRAEAFYTESINSTPIDTKLDIDV